MGGSGESSSSGEQWGRKTARGHQRVHHGVNAAPPHLPEAIGKGLKLPPCREGFKFIV